MAKVTDVKSYWREQAVKAGLAAEKLQQAEAMFDDPAFLATFQQGFKPLPDYSHDMDETRARAAAAKEAEYQDWFQKNKTQYEANLAEAARLKALGIDPAANGNNGNGNGNGGIPAMTQDQIQAMMKQQFEAFSSQVGAREQAIMEYAELRERHASEFKKPLNRAAFEDAWKQHPEWGTSLSAAYTQFTEPERETTRKSQMDAAIQAKYEEGVRDGFSRRSVPADAKEREFSPFFTKDTTVAALPKHEQERASREAFFDGLREAANHS